MIDYDSADKLVKRIQVEFENLERRSKELNSLLEIQKFAARFLEAEVKKQADLKDKAQVRGNTYRKRAFLLARSAFEWRGLYRLTLETGQKWQGRTFKAEQKISFLKKQLVYSFIYGFAISSFLSIAIFMGGIFYIFPVLGTLLWGWWMWPREK